MLDLVRYPSTARSRPYPGAPAAARPTSRLPTRGRSRLIAVAVWVAIAAAGLGLAHLAERGAFSRLIEAARPSTTATSAAAPAVASAADTLAGTFTLCGSGRRIDCVVDGDTFWYRGVKVRIADIDTPELSPPRCEAERVKGEAAKRRLRALLEAGPFSLEHIGRDEDRYGRKLRVVRRGGVSLGDMLIDEGLARRWDGARHPWCG